MLFKQKYVISFVETLETWNLGGNRIEHQGAQELAKALENNPVKHRNCRLIDHFHRLV